MDENQVPTPLYTLSPLNRFSSRAEDYAKYRPSYPTQAIDTILAGLATADELVAVDIGAGTGIAAQLLAERGVSFNLHFRKGKSLPLSEAKGYPSHKK